MTLNEAFSRFLDFLKRNLRSPKTITNYHSSLGRFLAKHGERPVADITLEDLYDYQDCLLAAEISHMSYKNHTINLRAFFKYLNLEGITNLKLHNITPPKSVDIIRPVMDETELALIMKHLLSKANTRKGSRDFAAFYALYSSGCRITEFLSLNRDSIVDGAAQVIGKFGKRRTVFFSPECVEILKMYLDAREDDLPPLFISYSNCARYEDSKRLTPSYLRKALTKIMKELGIKKPLCLHSFRHTFATILWKNGMDILLIQKALGHKSPRTTIDYIHALDKQVQEAIQKHQPIPLFKIKT